MKVRLGDGRTIVVRFRHEPPGRNRNDATSPPRAGTTCLIQLVTDTRDPEIREDIALGQAWLHPRDHYCKETGRKKSLARALEAVAHNEPCFDRIFDRRARREIWQAYFDRLY